MTLFARSLMECKFIILLAVMIMISTACPSGFDAVNSKCLTVTGHRFTHHKAVDTCQELNAHLVFIQTAIDNSAVLSYASNITTPMWLGLTCTVEKQPKQCLWDDGTAVGYSNFLPGYPVTSIGTCVYLDSSNQPLKGRWISATCGLDEYHAICEAN